MKILVTGATGFVGQATVTRLLSRGHQIVALSRSPDKARLLLPVECSVFPLNPPEKVLAGIEAALNLAGEPIAQGRWTRAKKDRIRSSRVDGTRRLAELLGTTGAKVLVSASAVGVYGGRGDEVLTEHSSLGEGFLANVCKEWEHEARALEGKMRVVCPRIAMVLGRDGGALGKLSPLFSMGLGGRLGSGSQWMSWIHLDDLVSLLTTCLEDDRWKGAVNAASPMPVRNREFTTALAHRLRRPAFAHAPRLALRLALGEMADALLSSQRVIPERTQELGFEFRFASLEKALEDIVRP